MLESILTHLHNWFLQETYAGTFTIAQGSITLPFLREGQYFRIVGSALNDGLHLYPAQDLKDEVFTGEIWVLAVPQALENLAEEIGAWQEKNTVSPYLSESLQGYSYSRAVNKSTGQAAAWQDVFRSRLNQWRKV